MAEKLCNVEGKGGEKRKTEIKTIYTNPNPSDPQTTYTITCDEDYSSYNYIIMDFRQQIGTPNNKISIVIPMEEFLDSSYSLVVSTYYAGQFSRIFKANSQTNKIDCTAYGNQYVIISETVRVFN